MMSNSDHHNSGCAALHETVTISIIGYFIISCLCATKIMFLAFSRSTAATFSSGLHWSRQLTCSVGRTGRRTTPLWFHTSLACTLPSFSGYGNTNSEGERRNKNKWVGDDEWAGEKFFFYVSTFQLVRAWLAKENSCKLFFSHLTSAQPISQKQ